MRLAPARSVAIEPVTADLRALLIGETPTAGQEVQRRSSRAPARCSNGIARYQVSVFTESSQLHASLRRMMRSAPSRVRFLAVSAFTAAVVLVAGSCSYLPHDRLSTVGSFTTLESTDAVIAEARALGVTTVRGGQYVGAPPLARNLAYERAGLHLVLHVKSSQGPAAPGLSTDAQLADFRTGLAATLDALHPSLVAVENEEVAPRFFTGTVDQYLAELDAAASVAHARKIPVTDGAITSTMAALAAWKDLEDRGHEAEATDFANRAFADQAWIRADLAEKPFTGLSRPTAEASRVMALQLIDAFRTAPIDAVNFHWYIDNDEALAQTIDYLQRATGKPVVTTEIGQHDTDPAVPPGHLQTTVADNRLAVVIWFDADGDPADGLHDAATHQLRPNGVAFQTWVADHQDTIRPT